MKIFCLSRAKEPYRAVIRELSLRAGVDVEFVKRVKGGCVVLDESGTPATLEKIRELVDAGVNFAVGGPDGTELGGEKLSLGRYTLNHQIAIIVLLDLLFRARFPDHPYNKH